MKLFVFGLQIFIVTIVTVILIGLVCTFFGYVPDMNDLELVAIIAFGSSLIAALTEVIKNKRRG
jgi:hypothetical protein